MKQTLLLLCFCSAMAFAQTNPSASPSNGVPNSPAVHSEGPFLRHLKARNSADWKGTKKVASKVAEDTGKVAAAVAVIPAIPIYFVGLLVHCSFHDCIA